MTTQEKLQRIQLIEQNMQNFLLQKQSLVNSQTEIDSALNEIKSTSKAYKIIGNVMVVADKDKLIKDLEEKKRIINLRLQSIEKQEEKLREELKDLQKEVIGKL